MGGLSRTTVQPPLDQVDSYEDGRREEARCTWNMGDRSHFTLLGFSSPPPASPLSTLPQARTHTHDLQRVTHTELR